MSWKDQTIAMRNKWIDEREQWIDEDEQRKFKHLELRMNGRY